MRYCPKCKQEKPDDRFYKRYTGCKDCRNEYRRLYCKVKPEYVALVARASRYGISVQSLRDLLENHSGICICGKKATDLDHCHITGKARGFLCRSCNLVLGHVKDNPQLLDKLAEYLRSSV